jgi:lysophospholipase L1-like esterase
MASQKKELNIVCFGDSLTEGYSQFGSIFTPYSETMVSKLQAAFPTHKISAVTDGVSGDRVVSGSFKRRMEARYVRGTTRLPKYDWVVFLGGTNDLGWGGSARGIWEKVLEITGIPLRDGAKLLLMTVPECGVRREGLDRRRDELNGLIRGDAREGVYVFDLHKHIPYHSMGEEERREIWDDGLHFASKGYERLGEQVAQRLEEIIEGEETKTAEGV